MSEPSASPEFQVETIFREPVTLSKNGSHKDLEDIDQISRMVDAQDCNPIFDDLVADMNNEDLDKLLKSIGPDGTLKVLNPELDALHTTPATSPTVTSRKLCFTPTVGKIIKKHQYEEQMRRLKSLMGDEERDEERTLEAACNALRSCSNL